MLITLVSELSARPVARIFVGYDPDLTELTVKALRISMASFVLVGVNLFIAAWFTGLGNGKVSAAVSFVRNPRSTVIDGPSGHRSGLFPVLFYIFA